MKIIYSLLFLWILFVACGQDTPEDIDVRITRFSVEDIANNGNASDLLIQFEVEDAPESVDFVRLVVNNPASNISLDREQVASASNFISIPLPESGKVAFQPSSEALDYAGAQITSEMEYQLFLLPVVHENEPGINGILFGPRLITLIQDIGVVTTLASGFSASGGVVVGSDDHIYLGNFGNGMGDGVEILKFSPDGERFEIFAQGIQGATGGAFDSEGNLYWSGYSENIVHKISPDGLVTDFATVPGPVAIKIDSNDHLYVSACNDNTVKKITPDGLVSTFAQSNLLSCTNGMALDNEGRLYVSNFENGNVFRVDSDGTVSLLADIPGSNSVNLAYHNDYLYVTVRAISRIYRISTLTGAFEEYAGTIPGNKDGFLRSAQLSLPNGIAVTNDGKYLIVNEVASSSADGYNPNILRRIEIIK